MADKLPCYFSLNGINYKNGFVTSCPQTPDQLHIIDHRILPSEIFNSEKFRQQRLELMSGQWPKGCHLCQEVEEAKAGKSMRADFAADESYYDPSTGITDFKGLKHIELRFSNSCNMSCLHCSDVYSSSWISKLKHYKPDAEDYEHKLIQLTRTMHKSHPDEDLSIGISLEQMEKIVDDLNQNFPNLERVDFAGGEVLYQKQFFPCLRRLANHPNAKNIEISFHTNFNARFSPVELSQLLEPFGKSIIHMSIDAGTNIYSYFRTGNWNVLVNNIKKFREVNNFTSLGLVCTTSAYQIMDIENVFESFLTLDVDWIDSSIVYTPTYMNPAIMMFNFKDNVLEDIRKTYEIIKNAKDIKLKELGPEVYSKEWHVRKFKVTKFYDSAINAVKNIEEYVCNYKGVSYSEYNAFLVYIRKTDQIWQQNFNDYLKNYKYSEGKLHRI